MQLRCALNIIALSYLHSRNHPIAHLIPTQRPFSFLTASRIYRDLANVTKKIRRIKQVYLHIKSCSRWHCWRIINVQ